ncbi:MAG: hypothetical protein QW702_09155 [Candidatus Bathyarchaeia archaeon]
MSPLKHKNLRDYRGDSDYSLIFTAVETESGRPIEGIIGEKE